ncbi:SAF domain-containing protein [Desulfosporosinus shakirovi]|uniref:SAF domain-containing protein n=1 Tax=Desulfosporosinus shakirovi TaxID=2885154 RepID=UPI001E295AF5|nr:SAF domain-containing protein [Desulfosporosinus sp. SRJS8]MCB8818608.1 SAF domain-containing protein [Desulfosporosinus sp. SRJS8]
MKKLSPLKGGVISIAGACIATYFIFRTALAVGGPNVEMVMMVNTVKPGRPITASDIRTETMPQKFAIDAMTDSTETIGKIAATELTPGHPLLKTDIAEKPMRDGLYVGEIGVRIPVDLISSGGAMPGDYVDILVSTSKQTNGQPSQLSTLFRGKRIVAVFNAGGQKIESIPTANAAGGLSMTPSAVYTPASVTIAANSIQERDQIMSAGKVALSISPWGNETSQKQPYPVQLPPSELPEQSLQGE